MASSKEFVDYQVWIKACDLTLSMYELTGERAFNEKPSITKRFREAVLDIAGCIAAGFEIGGQEQQNYFMTAKGLCATLRSSLLIARRMELFEEEEERVDDLLDLCRNISNDLSSFKEPPSRQKQPRPKPQKPHQKQPRKSKKRMGDMNTGEFISMIRNNDNKNK